MFHSPSSTKAWCQLLFKQGCRRVNYSRKIGPQSVISVHDRSFSTKPESVYDKISFIGVGKMASALIAPLVETSIQSAENISVYDVSVSAMDHIVKKYDGRMKTCVSIPDAVDGADLIVMAVKPQSVGIVYEELRKARELSLLRDDTTLLSVIAGKPIASFVEGTGIAKIARSMPNTPAQIGQGVTVWCCTPDIKSEEQKKIQKVLGSFGKSIYVEDESYIDMSTAISGSGPAYIFLLIEAMIDAGVDMGFSRETATTLVHQTILGSTMYAMETGEHPAVLRNQVTSPAGTTASALYELENGKFRTVIKDAVWACYRRSLEMGGSDSNVGPGRYSSPPAKDVSVKLSHDSEEKRK